MRARALGICLMLLGMAATAHANRVVTYGAGNKTCGEYLSAKQQEGPDERAVLDWLAGYLTGVNSTTERFNTILGETNLTSAVNSLDEFCRAHASTEIAVALDLMFMHARSTSARRTVESTTYGTGDRSCEVYRGARAQPTAEQIAFVDWLGGYVSGFNAVSLKTDNALNDVDLLPAVYWLDEYCRVHPDKSFVEAIEARLAVASHRDLTIPLTERRSSGGTSLGAN